MPNIRMTLNHVRLAFTDSEKSSLWEPRSSENGGLRWGCSFLLDPTTQGDQLQALYNACQQIIQEMIQSGQWRNINPQSIPICLHDGNLKSNLPGYRGMWYVNASRDSPPTIKDRDGRTDLTKSSGRPYSGCYANVLVEIWAQNNNWGKKVNCQLRGIQFVEDGEAFSGSPAAAADEFEPLETTPPPEWGALGDHAAAAKVFAPQAPQPAFAPQAPQPAFAPQAPQPAFAPQTLQPAFAPQAPQPAFAPQAPQPTLTLFNPAPPAAAPAPLPWQS